MPKPGAIGGTHPGSRENSGICQSCSISSGSSGTGGKILPLSSMSESVHSGLSCLLLEQAQEQEEKQQRSHQLAEFQRLREVHAAAQLKNLEDFLRMNHVSLRDSTSYATGMIYRSVYSTVSSNVADSIPLLFPVPFLTVITLSNTKSV